MNLHSIYAIYLYMTMASALFQGACIGYVVYLRKFIGFDDITDNGVLLLMMIGLVLVYDVVYATILAEALGKPGTQFVEEWGWWFGFVFPVSKGIITIIFTRRLGKGLSPNPKKHKKTTAADNGKEGSPL